MTQHLDDQLLSDALDDVLDSSARARVDAHLSQCGACAARLQKMRSVVAEAAALSRTADVPMDEWQRVRGRLAPRQWRSATAPWWTRRSALLAAGLALVIVSSTVTALLLRREPAAVVQAPAAAVKGAPLPSRLAAIEDDYAETARDLERELAARKHTLAPETIAAVERSLRTIDAAIVEAREALARDPGSETLARLLVAGHDQKIELLRRAARLATQS